MEYGIIDKVVQPNDAVAVSNGAAGAALGEQQGAAGGPGLPAGGALSRAHCTWLSLLPGLLVSDHTGIWTLFMCRLSGATTRACSSRARGRAALVPAVAPWPAPTRDALASPSLLSCAFLFFTFHTALSRVACSCCPGRSVHCPCRCSTRSLPILKLFDRPVPTSASSARLVRPAYS